MVVGVVSRRSRGRTVVGAAACSRVVAVVVDECVAAVVAVVVAAVVVELVAVRV